MTTEYESPEYIAATRAFDQAMKSTPVLSPLDRDELKKFFLAGWSMAHRYQIEQQWKERKAVTR